MLNDMTHKWANRRLAQLCLCVCIHSLQKAKEVNLFVVGGVGEGGGGGGVGEGGDCNKGTGSKVTQTDRYILKRKQRTNSTQDLNR